MANPNPAAPIVAMTWGSLSCIAWLVMLFYPGAWQDKMIVAWRMEAGLIYGRVRRVYERKFDDDDLGYRETENWIQKAWADAKDLGWDVLEYEGWFNIHDAVADSCNTYQVAANFGAGAADVTGCRLLQNMWIGGIIMLMCGLLGVILTIVGCSCLYYYVWHKARKQTRRIVRYALWSAPVSYFSGVGTYCLLTKDLMTVPHPLFSSMTITYGWAIMCCSIMIPGGFGLAGFVDLYVWWDYRIREKVNAIKSADTRNKLEEMIEAKLLQMNTERERERMAPEAPMDMHAGGAVPGGMPPGAGAMPQMGYAPGYAQPVAAWHGGPAGHAVASSGTGYEQPVWGGGAS